MDGQLIPRRELLRRIGQLEQVAGVRLVTLSDGIERGVRLLELRTGTGALFDVVVDRAFDVRPLNARERGELTFLEPGDERHYDLEIGVLDDAAAIERFASRIDTARHGSAQPTGGARDVRHHSGS